MRELEFEDFFARKGDGKPACPACGIRLREELREHVKTCLFWKTDGRKLKDYAHIELQWRESIKKYHNNDSNCT